MHSISEDDFTRENQAHLRDRRCRETQPQPPPPPPPSTRGARSRVSKTTTTATQNPNRRHHPHRRRSRRRKRKRRNVAAKRRYSSRPTTTPTPRRGGKRREDPTSTTANAASTPRGEDADADRRLVADADADGDGDADADGRGASRAVPARVAADERFRAREKLEDAIAARGRKPDGGAARFRGGGGGGVCGDGEVRGKAYAQKMRALLNAIRGNPAVGAGVEGERRRAARSAVRDDPGGARARGTLEARDRRAGGTKATRRGGPRSARRGGGGGGERRSSRRITGNDGGNTERRVEERLWNEKRPRRKSRSRTRRNDDIGDSTLVVFARRASRLLDHDTRTRVALVLDAADARARRHFSRRASLLATRTPRRDDDPHGPSCGARVRRARRRASPRASVPRRPQPRRPIGAPRWMPPVAFSSASVARAAPDAASRDPSARLATSRHARRGRGPPSPPPSPSPPRPPPPTPPPRPTSTGATSGTPSRSADLSDDAPSAFTLLGEPLVFWRDHTANAPDGTPTWRCTADKCPHRLVPLSEGRVNESGEIECGYHGWTFDGASGKCTSIPQLPSEGTALDTALASPRSCVTPYPTKLAQGMLWVLPKSRAGVARV